MAIKIAKKKELSIQNGMLMKDDTVMKFANDKVVTEWNAFNKLLDIALEKAKQEIIIPNTVQMIDREAPKPKVEEFKTNLTDDLRDFAASTKEMRKMQEEVIELDANLEKIELMINASFANLRQFASTKKVQVRKMENHECVDHIFEVAEDAPAKGLLDSKLKDIDEALSFISETFGNEVSEFRASLNQALRISCGFAATKGHQGQPAKSEVSSTKTDVQALREALNKFRGQLGE